MSWLILFVAGLFEVLWAIGLKYTEGFTKLLPSVLTITAIVISMGLLGVAVKQLPVGTAYAIWTGIGTVGTVVAGILLFNESASVGKILCVCLILSGIVGLKFLSTAPEAKDVKGKVAVLASAQDRLMCESTEDNGASSQVLRVIREGDKPSEPRLGE